MVERKDKKEGENKGCWYDPGPGRTKFERGYWLAEPRTRSKVAR